MPFLYYLTCKGLSESGVLAGILTSSAEADESRPILYITIGNDLRVMAVKYLQEELIIPGGTTRIRGRRNSSMRKIGMK